MSIAPSLFEKETKIMKKVYMVVAVIAPAAVVAIPANV